MKPKKSLGQHWLADGRALEAICEAARIGERDTVLEIGSGTGLLTRQLAKRAKQVIAVEKDEQLTEALKQQKIAKNLQIYSGDIRTFNLTNLPPEYKVAANIPYYLTSHLIRILSESSNPPARAALLVQKEVAQRATAKPGDMSLLSVTTQFFWDATLGAVIPAKLFTPPPKVDSQILILRRRDASLPPVEAKRFFQIVKCAFANRRKTLQNSLAGGLKRDKLVIAERLKRAGINPSARPQTLSLPQWHAVYRHLKDLATP